MQSIEEGLQHSCGRQAVTQDKETADNQYYALKRQSNSAIQSVRETWLKQEQDGKPVGNETAHATYQQKRKAREWEQ